VQGTICTKPAQPAFDIGCCNHGPYRLECIIILVVEIEAPIVGVLLETQCGDFGTRSGEIQPSIIVIGQPPLPARALRQLFSYQLSVIVTVADRKSTRLNSSHVKISYAVFCLKKKKKK